MTLNLLESLMAGRPLRRMRNNPDYSNMSQKELATAYLQGYAAYEEAAADTNYALRKLDNASPREEAAARDEYIEAAAISAAAMNAYSEIFPLLTKATKDKYLTMRAVAYQRADGTSSIQSAPQDVSRVRAMSRRNPTDCVQVMNAVNRVIRAKGLQFDGSVVPDGVDMDLRDLRNQHIGVTLTISGGRGSLSGDVAGGSFDLNGGVDEQARTIVYNLQDILKHMGRRNPSEYWKKNVQKATKAYEDRSAYVLGDIYSDRDDRDLSGLDFSKSNLNRANLSYANLSRADLSRANLIGANLRGANLSDANLSNANLIGADLIGANLTGAILTRANLFGANLTGADMRNADLRGAIMPGGSFHK